MMSRTLTTGHTKDVSAVAFSPLGDLVVTGSYDKTVRLWDGVSWRLVHTFAGCHSCEVRSVAFSPSGDLVASGSMDSLAALWDVRSRTMARSFRGHSSGITSVAFSNGSPNSTLLLLATASWDRTARLWDVRVGRLVHAFEAHSSGVYAVAFSEGNRFLATGSNDATAKLWDLGTRRRVHTFEGHRDAVSSVAFSTRTTDLLATGSWDNSVRVWSVRALALVHALNGLPNYVLAVAFSPRDDHLLAIASADAAQIWDLRSRARVRKFSGHSNAVTSVAFSPGGNLVATGSQDKTARFWELLPVFFHVFREAERESWSSEKALERLAPTVSDATQLALFYSAASAAQKRGEITLDERHQMIATLLNRAATTFRKDREGRVEEAFVLAVRKAAEDGIVDCREAIRLRAVILDRSDDDAAHFLTFVELLSSLDLRVERLADHTASLSLYAKVLENILSSDDDDDDASNLGDDHHHHHHHHRGASLPAGDDECRTAPDCATRPAIFQDDDDRLQEQPRTSTRAGPTPEMKMAAALEYAQHVDAQLLRLREHFFRNLQRRTAVNLISSVVGAMKWGFDAGVVTASDRVCGIFGSVVDFSDARHVLEQMSSRAAAAAATPGCSCPTEFELLASNENFEFVVDASLHNAIEDRDIAITQIKAAAFVKTILVCSDQPLKIAPSPLRRLGAASDAAEVTFAALQRELDCEDAAELELDAEFVMAFENCFDDVDLDEIGGNERSALFAKLKNRNGRVSLLTWKNFYNKWQKTNTSLSDHLATLAARDSLATSRPELYYTRL
ncbi:hypothetical protein CTAYLR_000414 [Chrysophaeum taylorii]|uniref:Uncharacterized protein n=1 Tax=Chrysophaeum taylorii TaxID=2483200 RepID=A0AAD7UGU6_9STRA|nr:hypothetical protein CTAYLR_000414 [Chrysophaeum taylorii]